MTEPPIQIDVGCFSCGIPSRIRRRTFVKAMFGLPFVGGVMSVDRLLAADALQRSKSVIFVWLWGGPSHIDTFDPKPGAPAEIRGPFAPISTAIPGVQFSELLPQLSQRASQFTVVRSNVNLDLNHHIAGSIALTGARGENGDDGYGPCFGSIVHRWRNGRDVLPSFISVTRGKLDTAIGPPKGIGGGKWGPAYDSFEVSCGENSAVELPSLNLMEGLSIDRLNDRRRLLTNLDSTASLLERRSHGAWNARFEQAYRLLTSPEGRRTFDLQLESRATRAAYGRTTFGQSCLLARRLVEAGVPFVQVNWSKWVENIFDSRSDFGWDTHTLNFEHLAERHGPIFDRAFSALVDDLKQRGLLETTMVVALGEFGRTPKISGNGGRDHWLQAYCSLWAGGGVHPGQVIGQTDETAGTPLTRPVTPDQVGATILNHLGIGVEQRAELRVLEESHPIEGLT